MGMLIRLNLKNLLLGLVAVAAVAAVIAFGVAAKNVGFKQIKEDVTNWYEKADKEEKDDEKTSAESSTTAFVENDTIQVIA